jgi:hypothetical protein
MVHMFSKDTGTGTYLCTDICKAISRKFFSKQYVLIMLHYDLDKLYTHLDG